MTDVSFSAEEYSEFREFLERVCGISLGEHKHYLVASRLRSVMKDKNLDSLGDVIAALNSNGVAGLKESIIEAMTTNETFWFRDTFPFEILKNKIFPELEAKSKSSIRIWSSACSSGQEAYSISMTATEYMRDISNTLPRVQVVATDISPAIVQKAKTARYDSMAVTRGLSEERKNKFFRPLEDGWEIDAEIRSKVQFSEHNLLKNYALLGKFDVIFCRNVLIYFSTEGKKDILERMAQSLNPNGYLFLGASESISSYSELFRMIHCKPGVVYQVL